MQTNQHSPTVKTVIFGADHFPKDPSMPALPLVASQVEAFQRMLTPTYLPGAEETGRVNLLNVTDNTRIKEELSRAAEQAPDVLLVYYVGYALFRRSQWYLTTANSTSAQVHVNGISLAELAGTIGESEHTAKVIVLDCAYLHTPEAGSELWQYAHEELHRTGDLLKNVCFLMASPKDAAYQREPRLAAPLTKLLEGGLRKNSVHLQLADIHDFLYEQFRLAGKATAAPLFYIPADMVKLELANNLKYIAFLEHKQAADRYFESENFAAAQPIYERAQHYYDTDDDVNAKTRFISFVLEAEKQFAQGQFAQAKKNYELAHELFDLAYVKQKTEQVIGQMAEGYFNTAQYEQAKAHYARLAATYPADTFFADRLRTCLHELKYGELIDSADEYYFRFDFENALGCYREALAIHEDRRTKRRMEECAQLMDKRATLREQLEAEIGKRVKAEVEQQFNAQFAETEQARLAELTLALTQKIQAETRADIDQRAWELIGQQTSPETYRLYCQLFPQGQHLAQATELAHQPTKQYPAENGKHRDNGASNGHQTDADAWLDGHNEVGPVETNAASEVAGPSIAEPAPTEQSSEEILWDKALKESTVASFLAYINQTEESAHIAEAYYQIGQLRHQETQEPVAAPIILPGSYATEEEQIFNPEELLWHQTVKDHTLEGYQAYLTQYPNRGHADEARSAMLRLQESAKMDEIKDWEMVTSTDTLEAYKAYISKYPFGNYYAKARFRIAKLEAELA